MNNKPIVAISADFLTAYAALPRQKQGKVTEFFNKFRNNPMHPGINFEKIEAGIDKNICSVRIDDTYRAIVVRQPESGVYILLGLIIMMKPMTGQRERSVQLIKQQVVYKFLMFRKLLLKKKSRKNRSFLILLMMKCLFELDYQKSRFR